MHKPESNPHPEHAGGPRVLEATADARPRGSIALKLTLYVALILTVLLGALLTTGYHFFREILREQIDTRLSAAMASRQEMLEAELAHWRQFVALLASNGEYRGLLAQLREGEAATANRGYSQTSVDGFVSDGTFLSAMIADTTGRVQIASKGAKPDAERAGDPVFQSGLVGPHVGQPRRFGDRVEVEISAPIAGFDPSRTTIGALLITLDVTWLAKAVCDTTGLGATGEVTLVAPEGDRVRFLFPRSDLSSPELVPRTEAPSAAAALAAPQTLHRIRDDRGEAVLVLGRAVGHDGWTIVAKIDEPEAYAPIRKALRYGLGVGALVVLAGLGAAFLLARGFTRPIRRLAVAAEAVAGGDLSVTVPVQAGNELGALAATFNEMIGALRVRTEERAKAEATLVAERTLLRTLIDVLPLSIYVKDTESRFLVANDEAAHSVGAANPAEVLGKTDADYFPPAIAAAFRKNEQQILAGKPVLNLEHDSTYPDGTARTEQTTKVPLRNAAGEIIGLVGVSRDITERKRAEEALRQSEALLRSITDHTADIIFVKDREFRTIFTNPAGFRATARPPGELIGRTDTEFIADPAQAAKFLADDRRVMESRQTLTTEEELTSASGEKRVLLTIKTPRLDAAGDVVGLVGVARDITAQKQVEKTLDAERSRLRTLIDVLPLSIYVKDGEHRFVVSNVECARALGAASPEAMLGRTDADYFSPAIAARFREDELRVLAGESVLNLEEESPHPDGTPRVELTTKVPLRDGSGAIIGIVGISRDITERKRAEEALRESQDRLKTVIENLSEGLIISDMEGHLLHWNRAALEQHEFSSLADVQRHLPEFVTLFELQTLDGKIVPYEQWPMPRIIRGEVLRDLELRIRRLDRDWQRICSYGGTTVRDTSGHQLAFLTVTDITARKQTEAALRDSERRFREIAESLPQLVWTCVEAGRCDYLSPQWVVYTGIPAALQLGERWLAQIHPDDRERTLEEWADVAMVGLPFDTEFRIRDHDGHYRWFRTLALPLRDDSGKVVKWFGTSMDIDDIKRATEEIQHLNASLEQRVVERTAQLEEANRELEGFSYSISHDLRAPLRAINGYAHILREDYADRLDEEGRRITRVVCSEAARMGNLIDALLQFSRLGRQAIAPATIDMTALAREAFDEASAEIGDRAIDFRLAELPPAWGDRTLVRQVWVNLISNAVKFTRRQEHAIVEVGARTEGDETVYWVRDNGAGFDLQYAGKLFGVFQRLHRQQEFEGTGVGLAFVHRIIARHGGRIWAESAPETGATFYFHLPDAATAPTGRPA